MEIISFFAGILAHQRFSGGPAHGAQGDYERALDLASRLCLDDHKKTVRLLFRCKLIAEKLIDAQWADIERVAAALMSDLELSGEQVIGILRE